MPPGAIRIPFVVAVDCGLEGTWFARNISKTGVYIEVPQSKKSAEVLRGNTIRMTIAPLGSAPSGTIEGTVTRIETIKLDDGSEGLGFGIQFKKLTEENQAALFRHVTKSIRETLAADDPRKLGQSVFEQAASNSLPSDDRFQPVRSFLAQLPTVAKIRIKNILANSFETSADWHLGQGHLLEIGIQALLANSQGESDAEKQQVMARLKVHVAAFQNELTGDSNVLDVGDYAVRKEVAEMITRLSALLKKAHFILNPTAQTAGSRTVESSSLDSYVGVFFEPVFFESYLDGKTTADILDSSARNLIFAIAQDWGKAVHERKDLSEGATALLKRACALAVKIAFEARQLYRARPLAKNLPSIFPHVKTTLVQFTDVQKQMKAVLDASPTMAQKEPLAAVGRGMHYLAALVTELQQFLSSLPVTPETAGAYYKETRLRPIIYDSKKAFEKRHSGSSISIPKPILYLGLLVVLASFVFLNLNYFWGFIYQFKPGGEGSELGITQFTISDDTFEGDVNPEVWNSLSSEEQQRLGEKFANKWVRRGIPRVILRTPRGDLVAKTMNFNGRRVWLVANDLHESPTPAP